MFTPNSLYQKKPPTPTKVDIPYAHLIGTNIGGMTQYHVNQLPFSNGVNGKLITAADVTYLKNKGFNTVRLLISQEMLQTNVAGANNVAYANFNATTWQQFQDVVALFTSQQIYTIIGRHQGADAGFGCFNGTMFTAFGGSNPGSILADFWRRIAERYKDDGYVAYDLDNEPLLGSSGVNSWWDTAQKCINAIRNAGAGQCIFVNGITYSGAVTWTSVPWNDPGGSGIKNSDAFLTLTDPCDNLIAEVHCYMSASGGGGDLDVVSGTIGRERLAPVVAWGNTNKKRFVVGEFANRPDVTNGTANIIDFIQYVKDNSRINDGYCVGSLWWVYAPYPFFDSYEYTLTTQGALPPGGTDSVCMDLLETANFFAMPTPVPAFDPLTSVPGIYAAYLPQNFNSGTGIWSNTGASTGDTTRDLEYLKPADGYANHIIPDYLATDASFNNQPSIGCSAAHAAQGSANRVGFRNRGAANFATPITGPCTIYSALYITKGSTLFWRKDKEMNGGTGSGSARLFSFNGLSASRDGGTTAITTNSSAVTTGTLHIVCTVYNGSSSAIYVNSYATAAVTGNVNTNSITSLGMGNTSTDAAWQWKMGDMYIYSAAHSAGNIQSMMTYLATKYNVTLT